MTAGYGAISRQASFTYATKTGTVNGHFRKADVRSKSSRFLRGHTLRLAGHTRTRIAGKPQCFVAHLKICS